MKRLLIVGLLGLGLAWADEWPYAPWISAGGFAAFNNNYKSPGFGPSVSLGIYLPPKETRILVAGGYQSHSATLVDTLGNDSTTRSISDFLVLLGMGVLPARSQYWMRAGLAFHISSVSFPDTSYSTIYPAFHLWVGRTWGQGLFASVGLFAPMIYDLRHFGAYLRVGFQLLPPD